MFETEAGHRRLIPDELPGEVLAQFGRKRGITHISLIKWEEHCTECAWPACYNTCDLYSPRLDGNCRRTVDGFSPVLGTHVIGAPVVRVRFKRWANLTARSKVAAQPVAQIQTIERKLNWLSSLAAKLPLGSAIGRPGLPARAVRRLKERMLAVSGASETDAIEPTCFMMEMYNPSFRTVEISLDIGLRPPGSGTVPFKRLISIAPGFHVVRIPFDDIRPHLGSVTEADLQLNPNILTAEEEGLTLYLGLIAFACEGLAKTPEISDLVIAPPKKIKVVIWDLDNTLWDGTLIEDGTDNIKLRAGVLEVIQALDERGIVNSIASKNHPEAAMAQLARLGVSEYFVFPEISWGRKSEAVRRIVKAFNVGADTVAFIDDQPFEREEVREGNPEVRVFRHSEVHEILNRDEFSVPVTEEARNRRLFYKAEEARRHAMADVVDKPGSDYLNFLRRSNIRIKIERANTDHLDRVHELVQRTNQMNFSGRRYGKDDLRAVLSQGGLECYLVDAVDDFGKYGWIGFAVVELGAVPRVKDLAFSCRIQAKRVEHAVLISLMEYYAERGARSFEVFYRGTDKNEPVSKVFKDLHFSKVWADEIGIIYEHELGSGLPVNDVVQVLFPARALMAK